LQQCFWGTPWRQGPVNGGNQSREARVPTCRRRCHHPGLHQPVRPSLASSGASGGVGARGHSARASGDCQDPKNPFRSACRQTASPPSASVAHAGGGFGPQRRRRCSARTRTASLPCACECVAPARWGGHTRARSAGTHAAPLPTRPPPALWVPRHCLGWCRRVWLQIPAAAGRALLPQSCPLAVVFHSHCHQHCRHRNRRLRRHSRSQMPRRRSLPRSRRPPRHRRRSPTHHPCWAGLRCLGCWCRCLQCCRRHLATRPQDRLRSREWLRRQPGLLPCEGGTLAEVAPPPETQPLQLASTLG